MNPGRFYKELGMLTAASLAAVVMMSLITALQPYLMFMLCCVIFFAGLSLTMFLVGMQTLRADNLMPFSNFSLFYGFSKMLLAVVLLFLFKKYGGAANNHFVIPFLMLYFVYVIFETRVLMKLGKTTAN